LYSTISQ